MWIKCSLDLLPNLNTLNPLYMRIHFIILNVIYPLALEFEIPTKPINIEDKMVTPMQEPMSVRITLYSPFLQSKWLQ